MSDKLPPLGCFWQGDKIRLRAFSVGDVEVLRAEEQDSEAIRLSEGTIKPLESPETLKDSIEREAKQPPDQDLRLVVETLDGTMVGDANLRDWNNRSGTFTFGIRIFRAYRRRGFATEAVQLLLRYGFYELRCQKANSITLCGNEPSVRLHRIFGFRDEGRIRRAIYTEGRYFDKLLFGLTSEEFDEIERSRSTP